jgi:hypothetical protein
MNRPAARISSNAAGKSLTCWGTFLATLLLCATAAAQAPEYPANKTIAQPTRRIVVSFPDRKLALLEEDRVIKIYDVAVGAPSSPSPSGEFKIVRRLENPGYYQPGVVVAPGESNPLGTRWIGLNIKGFGIHGTNQPGSIGKFASHGCIRLRNGDIEDLFARVQVGDRVSLVAQRTNEVAHLFGGAASDQETLQARNESFAARENEMRGQR